MESKDFLFKLLTTPSPSGFEQPVQRVVRDRMKKYSKFIETDLHGNVIVGINTKASRKMMISGHCDTIGLMIRHITKEGYLYVAPLGGVDVGVLHGTIVWIHTAKGPVTGVVGRKPLHLQTGEERDKTKNDIEKIWIDIGAKNKKEAEKKVELGDPISFALGVTEFGNSLVSSAGLDDKAGLFVAMETLRICSSAKIAVGLYAVSTVQEELGLRGAETAAFGIEPEIGIAVDVTHANDNPGHDNTKIPPISLGGGPVITSGPNINPVVAKMLKDAAKKSSVVWQPMPNSKLLGNEARSIQVSRAGVATGSICIPNRYMHTQVETCSLKDLEGAIKLLVNFVKSITPKTDFRPG